MKTASFKKLFIFQLAFFVFLFFTTANYSQVAEEHLLKISDEAVYTPILTLSSPLLKHKIKLFGMLHFADKEYYELILKNLESTQLIFYEGVTLSKNQNLFLPIYAQVETKKSTILDIFSQTDFLVKELNFSKQTDILQGRNYPNWFNADISIARLNQSILENNIDFKALENYSKNENSSFLKEFHLYRKMKMGDSKQEKLLLVKKKLAQDLLVSLKQLIKDEQLKPLRDVIIILRNEVVAAKLEKILKSEESLELALLYGVAHLPNFVEILSRDYKFAIESVDWLEAWNLQR